MWQGLAKARLQRVLEQIIFNSVFFTERKIKIIYQTFNFNSSNPQSIVITKLRLCHYPVKPVYFNLSVHEFQFHSCSFNVECKTKSPRLSQSTPMELLVKMVQHFRLQLFRISTWFSWFPYSVHYYISATNICGFHILQLIIFPPAVFKISIFCDLSCHIRLQTSRFPQTTTCKISACNFLDFHAVNLKRFPPAVFENSRNSGAICRISFCNSVNFHNQECKR